MDVFTVFITLATIIMIFFYMWCIKPMLDFTTKIELEYYDSLFKKLDEMITEREKEKENPIISFKTTEEE